MPKNAGYDMPTNAANSLNKNATEWYTPQHKLVSTPFKYTNLSVSFPSYNSQLMVTVGGPHCTLAELMGETAEGQGRYPASGPKVGSESPPVRFDGEPPRVVQYISGKLARFDGNKRLGVMG